MYLTSSGRPTDVGSVGQGLLSLQQAVPAAGKGKEGILLFLQFLHLYSISSFSPVSYIHLLYYLFTLISPFLWETT